MVFNSNRNEFELFSVLYNAWLTQHPLQINSQEPEATQAEKPSEEPKGKDKVVPRPKRSPKTVSTTAASSASAAPRRGRPPKATSGGRKRAAAKKAATANGKAKAKAKGKTVKKPATSETTEVEDGDGSIPKTSKRPTAMKRPATGHQFN